MKNKHVGFLIIGISALIGFIIYSFNRALSQIVDTSCSHGQTCPMWGSINVQTNISSGLLIFVALIGFYFVFFAKEDKGSSINNLKKIDKENYQHFLKELNEDEKQIFNLVLESEGTIFQSDLVDKSKFNKVKITRLLDRLEGKDIIQRKRRGMTNIIILKH